MLRLLIELLVTCVHISVELPWNSLRQPVYVSESMKQTDCHSMGLSNENLHVNTICRPITIFLHPKKKTAKALHEDIRAFLRISRVQLLQQNEGQFSGGIWTSLTSQDKCHGLCYRPAVFFLNHRLTVLSFPQGKTQGKFQNCHFIFLTFKNYVSRGAGSSVRSLHAARIFPGTSTAWLMCQLAAVCSSVLKRGMPFP